MSDPPLIKINAAVHACLESCYPSPTPLKAIAEFMNRLDLDPEWSPDEIEKVETSVLRMLVKIARRPAQGSPDHDEPENNVLSIRLNRPQR